MWLALFFPPLLFHCDFVEMSLIPRRKFKSFTARTFVDLLAWAAITGICTDVLNILQWPWENNFDSSNYNQAGEDLILIWH